MQETAELHVVLGAGPAGAATARALIERGVRVRVVTRHGIRRQTLPAEAEVAAADLADAAQARSVTAGAAVLYQCVGAPYHRWPEEFPALQAGILRAAEEAGARLVVLENLYMYGPVSGPMTEDLPYEARTRKGRVRADMARELVQAHEKGRVSVAIGRASDFYGPGVTESALGAMVFRPLLRGQAAWAMGNPDVPHSYSYIDDVGRGLVTLGFHPGAAGRIWHLPCAPASTTRRAITLAAGQIDKVPRVKAMGRLALRMGGLFSKSAREMVEMLYQFERPFVVDDTRFRQTFGQAATPLDQGLRETIGWYRTLET